MKDNMKEFVQLNETYDLMDRMGMDSPYESIIENKATAAAHTIMEEYTREYEEYCSLSPAERKELFRKDHREIRNMNENVLARFFGKSHRHTAPVPINEVTLDRIINKHGVDGLIIVSANRTGMPKEYNDEKTKALIDDLRNSKYSFLPTYRGYRNLDTGVEDDYEVSFIVFNHDTSGRTYPFEELYKFGLRLCGEYDQDSITVKAPNDPPMHIDRDGNKVNNNGESEKVYKNSPREKFFTSLKSKEEAEEEIKQRLKSAYKKYRNDPFNKDSFDTWFDKHRKDADFVGKRWTYDIRYKDENEENAQNECRIYLNPMPDQINEHRSRGNELTYWWF